MNRHASKGDHQRIRSSGMGWVETYSIQKVRIVCKYDCMFLNSFIKTDCSLLDGSELSVIGNGNS